MRNVKIGFLNEMERNVLKMIDDGKPLDDGVWGTGDEWLENLSNGNSKIKIVYLQSLLQPIHGNFGHRLPSSL